MNFYPRSPCGERLRAEHHASNQQEFLSTLSLRRATTGHVLAGYRRAHFYPRSPCGERRILGRRLRYGQQFLSTLSLRRATQNRFAADPHCLFLSTLSLRRATNDRIALIPHQQFLSTLSLRRATFSVAVPQHVVVISIHALLAESDADGKCR